MCKALQTFFIVVSCCFTTLLNSASGQGSPDAVESLTRTDGLNHATVKIYSEGYSTDTTELKFTNMTQFGTGTEFVVRSSNETGLNFSSNSDLLNNTTEDILVLAPNGNISMNSLSGSGAGVVIADNNGNLKKLDVPRYYRKTNLNVPGTTVNAASWTPVGPTFTFTKAYDETIVDAQMYSLVRWDSPTAGAGAVAYRVEILGQPLFIYASGRCRQEITWEFASSRSIYDTLPAGTYTAQIHARTNTGTAFTFFDDRGWIFIEERL